MSRANNNQLCTSKASRIAQGTASLCLLLTLGLVPASLAAPSSAHADDLATTTIGTLQQFEIEALEKTYDDAMAAVEKAEEAIAENQAKIDVLEEQIPVQQERSDESMRALYIMQQNKLDYIEVLLDAKSFDEFVKQVDYYKRVNQLNLEELNKLKAMRTELQEAKVALDGAKAQADANAETARTALVALQDQRSQKQWRGVSQALSQSNDARDASVIPDGADWHMTEKEFVAEWAPRIDAYLAGSPLEGTGETFALASFRYCVDPRWSPAIANSESSKGLHCIRPYNAWGWGAADSDPYNLAYEWSSWEEAIDAHVRGLANGYGYTISWDAAKKYCSSWESWYPNTLSEMSRI